MTPDECIAAMWEIENAHEDGDGVTFDASSDQWWGLFVFCGHSDWTKFHRDAPLIDYAIVHVVSRGAVDLSTAFEAALVKFREVHAALPVATGGATV